MTNDDTEINTALGKMTAKSESLIEQRKEALTACISFGKKLSQIAQEVPSLKLRGKVIAERFPESQNMDPAHRSHCKWLYEALNKPGHAANDILQVLGLKTIFEICGRTWHPTVISKRYAKAKAQMT